MATRKSASKKTPTRKSSPARKPAEPEKKAVKRVPPRIVRRPPPPSVIEAMREVPQVDTAKAVAFAMSIAEEMKRAASKSERSAGDDGVRLSRRPTTRAQGRTTEKFPAADLKDFRKRLLEARARAMAGLGAMKEMGFNESEDHEADGGDGTAQTLRLQALGQVGSINRTIQQIDEAMHRIEDGTYGVCTVCGQLIRKPRLLNQPFVLTCMECQSEMEREAK